MCKIALDPSWGRFHITVGDQSQVAGNRAHNLAAAQRDYKRIIVLEKVGSTVDSSAMTPDLFGVESIVQKQNGADVRN